MRIYMFLISFIFFQGFIKIYPSPPEIQPEWQKLTPHIYRIGYKTPMIQNYLAFTGKDGVLMVDTCRQMEETNIKSHLQQYGTVKYIINTHADGDHVRGNRIFADTATIIAHQNTRERMSGKYYYLGPTYPPGLPAITFKKELVVWFNDEEIQLAYYASMHTNEDVVVHFTRSKIVYLGDLIAPDCYPFFHLDIGGDFPSYPEKMRRIIRSYPDDALYVSTHGRNYTKKDLKAYLERFLEATELIKKAKNSGKSAKEILEEGFLFGWDPLIASGAMTENSALDFIQRAFFPERKPDRISINKPLTKAIVEGGVASAISLYGKLLKAHPDRYIFDETQLNNLGYNLLGRKMVREAIEIFKLNASQYPESGNVYDSLAEAYMTNGQNDQAIRFYRQSLVKDPQNENAKAMLRRLEPDK